MQANGIKFVREPEDTDYGTVAVFADLYGNLWDLIEHSPEYSPEYSEGRHSFAQKNTEIKQGES